MPDRLDEFVSLFFEAFGTRALGLAIEQADTSDGAAHESWSTIAERLAELAPPAEWTISLRGGLKPHQRSLLDSTLRAYHSEN